MKMITCMFALSVLVALPLSAEQHDALSRIKSLVGDVEAINSGRGVNRPDVFVDTLPEACSRPEYRALQEALKQDWPVAISNLNEIAKTDLEKTIVLCSSWYISKEDFAVFLGEAATLVEQGELNRDIFMWCQNPFESPLHGFLIRNYKDPRVQDILIRTRAIFSDQPERVATYDRILSGKSLKGLEKYEADMQEGWGFAIRRKLASPFRSLVAPATPGAEKVSGSKRWFRLPVVAGVIAGLICTSIWILRRRR